jgi:hypothetical protein
VLKISLSAFLLLTATVAGWRVHQRDQLERRARRAVNTLRYTVDPESNNVEPISVVYYPTHSAVCIEYRNLDQVGLPYLSRAVLLDHESRISYAIDSNDELWENNCGEVYSRNLVDLTDARQNDWLRHSAFQDLVVKLIVRSYFTDCIIPPSGVRK